MARNRKAMVHESMTVTVGEARQQDMTVHENAEQLNKPHITFISNLHHHRILMAALNI